MLINLSNHPYEKWDQKQLRVAIDKYGSVKDIQFPAIDSMADSEHVFNLAAEYLALCKNIGLHDTSSPIAIHIAGELCFVFHFVTLAKFCNLMCICSTTQRVVTEEKNIKTSIFEFVRFRNYF